MNTNQIKKFACEARNILKRGIAAKITTLGFDAKGDVAESMMPQLMQGGSLWKGELQTEGFYRQWMALYHRVQQKGIQEVYEEAAYTWFNRLMAIRIMQKNGLCEPVLVYTSSARTPRIVDEARMNRMPQMREETRTHLMELLDDDTKVTEQFALLISAWCHANPIMQACFGTLADYTELLLPQNILAEGGFVDMINHTEFITDDDFHSPELIGWLYQFYISERKDEVFAKKGKFEADEIPAATQIFTPNWIVKYMVQNTVGRIFLDNNPGPNPFKDKWQYLVDQEPQADENIYRYNELTDLKVADLACGSGHILNECFDILYDLYIYEGYSRNEAIENIFAHNLTGIDLDNRAKQLATFALMIKACQKDSNFIDAHALPKVLTMPNPLDEEVNGSIADFIHHFFQGTETKQITDELVAAFDLMKDADSLGSIMKFDISERTRYALDQTVEHWKQQEFFPQAIEEKMPAMELILTLTEKYSALVMNPPYMKAANMNDILKSYVEKEYNLARFDMYSVFMKEAMDKTKSNSYFAMIVQPTWLVNYSFGELREFILRNFHIDSLLHMGRGNFGNDWGSIAFVLNKSMKVTPSCFFKLFERTFYKIEPEHISQLFLKAKNDTNFKFKFSKYLPSTFQVDISEGNRIYYSYDQNKFMRINNSPFCYTFSDEIVNIINTTKIIDHFSPATGLQSGGNAEFIRDWSEVSFKKVRTKWFPYINGGNARRWYGNLQCFVNWENEGYEIKHIFNPETGKLKSRPQSQKYYFREGATWNRIASKGITLRYLPEGCIFDQAGDSMFSDDIESIKKCIAYLNTKVGKTFFDMLAPGINLTAGTIGSLPYIPEFSKNRLIVNICDQNIEISHIDWDAHETSWDFKTNELISLRNQSLKEGESEKEFKLSSLVGEYKKRWEDNFMQLHANEEELNRQFIEIYGLQDELTPDVPLDEITILQQGEISIENNVLQWHDDVLIKQLISYAVGIWMGRYRLDKPGLHIAHPEPTSEELEAYSYGNETVNIDDDGIIPILPLGYSFDDNLCRRIADFVRIAFGADSLTENLNFIEKCLGTTIEQYVMKDFWKDHKKMYQNRPIYWLFSSKKGAFKCITYMHRMTPYTAEQVRSKYLLPYIEQLQARINDLESRAASLTTAETRQLTALKKTIEECQEYHERLQVVAEDTNITGFDLDDGVVVNYAKYGDVLQKLK